MRWLSRSLAALLAAAALACGGGEIDVTSSPLGTTSAPSCSGRPRSAIVTHMAFTRESTKGIAEGFDLDRTVSNGQDAGSCKQPDFVDPDGHPGIDNQLATLIPDIESIVGGDVDGLVQNAINNGLLLISLDLEGLDSPVNDSCVGFTVRLADGKPTLGTDGVIEGFQTFRQKPDALTSHTDSGKLADGTLVAGPFDVGIPLKIFDVSFTLRLYDAYVRFRIGEDGHLDGYLGGGIVPEELIDGIKDGAGLAKSMPLLLTVLRTASDLHPDAEGKCQRISVAVAIKAAPAFVVP